MERLSHSRPTMPLTLRAVSLNDQPITQPITASFGPKGGSIGRADTNTLAAARTPSAASRGARPRSSLTGDGLSPSRTSAAPIRSSCATSRWRSASRRRCEHGDQVRIGGYLLEVTDERRRRRPNRGRRWPRLARRSVRFDRRCRSPPARAAAPSRSGARRFRLRRRSPTSAARCRPAIRSPSCSVIRRAAPAAPSSLPVRHRRRRPEPAARRLRSRSRRAGAAATAAAQPRVLGGSGAFDDLIPSVAPASIDSLFGLSPGRRAGSARRLPRRRAGCRESEQPRRAAPRAVDRSARSVRPPSKGAPASTPSRRRCPTRRRSCARRSRSASACRKPRPTPSSSAGRRRSRSPRRHRPALEPRRCAIGAALAGAAPASLRREPLPAAGRGVHRPPRHRLVPRRPRRLERPLRRRRRPPRPAAEHRPRPSCASSA